MKFRQLGLIAVKIIKKGLRFGQLYAIKLSYRLI